MLLSTSPDIHANSPGMNDPAPSYDTEILAPPSRLLNDAPPNVNKKSPSNKISLVSPDIPIPPSPVNETSTAPDSAININPSPPDTEMLPFIKSIMSSDANTSVSPPINASFPLPYNHPNINVEFIPVSILIVPGGSDHGNDSVLCSVIVIPRNIPPDANANMPPPAPPNLTSVTVVIVIITSALLTRAVPDNPNTSWVNLSTNSRLDIRCVCSRSTGA